MYTNEKSRLILCRKWIYLKLGNLILYILFHSCQYLNIDLSIKKCVLFQLMVIDILISPDNTGTKMQIMCLVDLINNGHYHTMSKDLRTYYSRIFLFIIIAIKIATIEIDLYLLHFNISPDSFQIQGCETASTFQALSFPNSLLISKIYLYQLWQTVWILLSYIT